MWEEAAASHERFRMEEVCAEIPTPEECRGTEHPPEPLCREGYPQSDLLPDNRFWMTRSWLS